MRPALLITAALLTACGGTTRPIADPGEERTVQSGEPVTFDGSASRGEIDSYLWDFGDGSEQASGITVEHTFATEGDYSVSLTVRGPGGASTAGAVVHVGKGCLPTAQLDVLTSSPAPGTPVQFSAGNSAACAGQSIASYRWDFGDGTIIEGAGESFVSHTYANKGTYSVALEIFDGRGAKGRATRELNVGVLTGNPLVQCSGPTNATVGSSGTYTATASDPAGGTITEYAWTFSDDDVTVNGAQVSHTFTIPGAFTAQVIAKTDDGRASDPCVVNVNVSAPVDYSGFWLMNPASPSLSGCSKFTVAFPATYLSLTHSGTSMTAAPSGNSWPTGSELSGMRDSTQQTMYRLRGTTPQQDKSSSGCGTVTPDHSVELTFSSATTFTGKWTVIYDFACVPNCSASCNCVATGTFTGKLQ